VSGHSLIECAAIADKCRKLGAVGLNCTPPRFIHGLILSIRKVSAALSYSFLTGVVMYHDLGANSPLHFTICSTIFAV
jgi:S-methylmethionine-dependent homocysteine/selenocysteine methylase